MNAAFALVKSPFGTVSGQRDCPANYDAISDRHRRVARMIGFGFCDETIAEACNMHTRAVWDIRRRPEVLAYVGRLKELARFELIERKDQFDALLQESIEVYREILNDEGASLHLKFRVACAVMDRHPDAQFVRGQKSTNQTQHLVDDDAIARLKTIASRTNLELAEANVQSHPLT